MENVGSDPVAALKWIKKPQKSSDGSWDLSTARLNLCYNALDRHVIDGRADDDALMYESTLTGEKASFTYAELLDEVARAAGVLAALGVENGQSVILCLPAIPELVISMLACMRLGVAFDVVSPDIVAGQIAERIDDVKPVVVISSSSSSDRNDKSPMDDALVVAEHHVGYRVVIQTGLDQPHLSDTDFDWAQVMKPGAVQSAGCASVPADELACVLRIEDALKTYRMTAGELAETVCSANVFPGTQPVRATALNINILGSVGMTTVLLGFLFAGWPLYLIERHEDDEATYDQILRREAITCTISS